MARLRAHLARHKAYPRRARARRIEGTATVRFTVHPDGHITDARIAEGSGSTILDRAARELLREADPAPTFPDDLPAEPISLTVPVRYGLR
jgi:protein TonB